MDARSGLSRNTTWALDSDKEQPIQIVADVAVRDEVAGETRYEGNVVLTQGSLQITADKLSIQHSDSGADRIVATVARHTHPAAHT